MALRSSQKPTRLPIPHEPGQWIEYRQLSAHELDQLREGDYTALGYTLRALEWMLTGWSYDQAPCADTIADLDAVTTLWLDGQLLELAGIRTEPEKKDSTNGSSPTSDPAPDASPPNSDT